MPPPGMPVGMPPVNDKPLDPKDDPMNWKETKTENGDVYYYNTVTEDVSWERPAGYIPVSPFNGTCHQRLLLTLLFLPN